MRLAACMFPALLFLGTTGIAFSQDDPRTDLRRDGLLGQVKSVSTTLLREGSQEQRSRISFEPPGSCRFCEFDRDGNEITNGNFVDGHFAGDRISIHHNPDGLLERVTIADAGPGQSGKSQLLLTRSDLVGPAGVVDMRVYLDGEVYSRWTTEYDGQGRVSRVQTFDRDGKLTNTSTYRRTADGKLTELLTSSEADFSFTRLTWDPESDETRYIEVDSSGALQESWRIAHGKTLSFWEAPEEPGKIHAHLIVENDPEGNSSYFCAMTSGCTVNRTTRYLSSDNVNIRRTDFRDETGRLKMTAEYEYEFDSNHNWTHRKVWVKLATDPAPFLFSEEVRNVTYWDK